MATTRKDEAEKIKKQEEKIRDIQKDLFTLANYYFVFQGVVFTAVFNNSTTLKCKYRWLPITLSLIAGLLNFMALFQISQKYLELLRRQDMSLQLFLSNDSLKAGHAADDQQRVRRSENAGPSEVEEDRRVEDEEGIRGSSRTQEDEQQNNLELAVDPNTHKLRRFILALCMLLFLGFVAVNVIASALILCQENYCNNYYGRSTCLNLCDQEKCIVVCPQH